MTCQHGLNRDRIDCLQCENEGRDRRRAQIATARHAEAAAHTYGTNRAAEITRNRNSAPGMIMSLEWLEAVLTGAFEDGYKAAL